MSRIERKHSSPLPKIQSTLIEDRKLRVSYRDKTLFEYNYRPNTETHYCPRPYLHPIYTLSGDLLTNDRPVDHPWHQGLSLTMNSINGMNFWGGRTYQASPGEYSLLDNVGSQKHVAWINIAPVENGYSWTETLNWIGPKGQTVFKETRALSVVDINPEIGIWRLLWESKLTNTLGEPIRHNSYCSGEGLQGSGYTGLFLRLSKGFDRTGKHLFDGKKIPKWEDYHDGMTAFQSPDEINGWQSSRLAYQGTFDSSLNHCCLLCEDLTENPPYQLHWFCRPQFPAIAWSTAYHNTHYVEVGQTVNLKHGLSIVDGLWTMNKANEIWVG